MSIREEIAKVCFHPLTKTDTYEIAPEYVKDAYRDVAHRILSLHAGKYTLKELVELADSGKIAVLAGDQLPPDAYEYAGSRSLIPFGVHRAYFEWRRIDERK